MSGEAHGAMLRYLRSDASNGLRPEERLVLLLLANRHNNDEGQARPSVKLLAREAGMSVRATQYTASALEVRGLVLRVPRFDTEHGGRQTANSYQLAGVDFEFGIAPPVQLAAPPRCKDVQGAGATACIPPVQLAAPLEKRREETPNNQMKQAGPPAAPRQTRKGYLADPLSILWAECFGEAPKRAQAIRIFELADIAAGKGLFDLVPNAIRATALDGKGFRWFESKAEAWITNGGPDARPRAPRTRALNTGTGGGTSTGTPAPMTDEQTREWQERYARQNGYADQQAAG